MTPDKEQTMGGEWSEEEYAATLENVALNLRQIVKHPDLATEIDPDTARDAADRLDSLARRLRRGGEVERANWRQMDGLIWQAIKALPEKPGAARAILDVAHRKAVDNADRAADPTPTSEKEREPGNVYRKRPVEVEAMRLPSEDEPPSDDLVDWLNQFESWEHGRDGAIIIHTLEGSMRADPGDWIISGVEGEIYPCKPDIFRKTYEPADPHTRAEGEDEYDDGWAKVIDWAEVLDEAADKIEGAGPGLLAVLVTGVTPRETRIGASSHVQDLRFAAEALRRTRTEPTPQASKGDGQPDNEEDGVETLMPFTTWWGEFRRVAVQEYGWNPTINVSREDWRPYYDQGLSPKDAIDEDVSHA